MGFAAILIFVVLFVSRHEIFGHMNGANLMLALAICFVCGVLAGYRVRRAH